MESAFLEYDIRMPTAMKLPEGLSSDYAIRSIRQYNTEHNEDMVIRISVQRPTGMDSATRNTAPAAVAPLRPHTIVRQRLNVQTAKQ